MKFHLLVLVLSVGAVFGQYGDNAPAETAGAANPAAPAVAPSTDPHQPMVLPQVDAPAAGCPIVDPAPAPEHCKYEQVEENGCKKPVLKCDCPVNEEFRECASCEPTCDNPSPVCTQECKPAKCQCMHDHARHSNGQCVPVDKCNEKAPEAPTTSGAQPAASGSCASMKCESNYECNEQAGGCVKKSTGNCAVSPCEPNHKCVENVGCKLEESQVTEELTVPVAANADMMPHAQPAHADMMMPQIAHSTDVAHEETIPIPQDQAASHVSCADTKCSPGSVCIEEYGCFTPHDRFVMTKTGMVESSCEKVFCDKQRSRCVHGSCVPLKMPWKLGHVCTHSPCSSPSMLCVDDIGCFDAPAVAFAMDRPTRGIGSARVKRDGMEERSTLVAHDMPAHEGGDFSCSPGRKCGDGEVCIELVGCFKPQDKLIYKDGRMVESSCADVVCNQAESRCVHGNCVPKKAPFRPGFVCARDAHTTCPSDSLCVDDIGCFSAPVFGAEQKEEGPETVAKTDSAAPAPAAGTETTNTEEVKTPA